MYIFSWSTFSFILLSIIKIRYTHKALNWILIFHIFMIAWKPHFRYKEHHTQKQQNKAPSPNKTQHISFNIAPLVTYIQHKFKSARTLTSGKEVFISIVGVCVFVAGVFICAKVKPWSSSARIILCVECRFQLASRDQMPARCMMSCTFIYNLTQCDALVVDEWWRSFTLAVSKQKHVAELIS